MSSQARAIGKWTGSIALGDRWGIYVGHGATTPMHRHLAFKVVVGLDGPVQVQFPSRAPLVDDLVLIAPQELHAVDASTRRVALLFIEPRALARAERGDLEAHLPDIAQAMRDFSRDGNLDPISRIVRTLFRDASPLPRQMDDVRADLATGDRTVAEIASARGLSESRLSHLFSEHMGVPPSRFRRWSRLRHAATLLVQGMSITDAALEAGFSDAPHMGRCFNEMAGITPGTFSASELTLIDEDR